MKAITKDVNVIYFSYFKESWCVALFHDRFKDLRSEIREILSSVKVNTAPPRNIWGFVAKSYRF